MMIAKVKFEIIAGLYTNFLNDLSNEDILLSKVEKTQLGFTAIAEAKNFKIISKIARKHGCKIRIVRKIGLYFKARPYMKRKGILVGVLLFFMLIPIFNNIIWRIEVDTYNQSIVNDVLKVMYENDIYVGKFYNKDDFETATEQIFLENEDIGNVALNFYKGVLVCDIDERDKKEEYIEEEGKEYILSLMDGVINDLRVYSGFSTIKVGDIVSRGDILVFSSSVFLPPPSYGYIPEDFVFPMTSQRPRAYITADCKKQYITSIDLNKEIMVLTGEKDSEIYLQLFNFDFKVSSSKIEEENSIAKQKIESFDIFGFSLPITVNKTTYYERDVKTLNYDENDIENVAINHINTIINQDDRLVEVLEYEYSMEIYSDKIVIICDVLGEFEITI